MKGSEKGEGPLASRSGGNKGQGISDGERGSEKSWGSRVQDQKGGEGVTAEGEAALR